MDVRSHSPSMMSDSSMTQPIKMRGTDKEDDSWSHSPSMMSDSSMTQPIKMRGTDKEDDSWSHSPSMMSDSSMTQPIKMRGREKEDDAWSHSPSMMSDSSMTQPIKMRGTDKEDDAWSHSPSMMSDSSMTQPIKMRGTDKEDDSWSVSSSMTSGVSMTTPNSVNGRETEDNESLRSGSAADSGVCMKADRTHELTQNISREERRENLRYAKAGDVACDLCEGRKLRAYKSCMTCLASFCEKHIRGHYTIEALQRHLLVEVTKNLNILQENAQLRKENAAMKDEIKTLKQTIRDLRLPDFICKGKTPVSADLTLDPDTAYCALILSKSQKRVRLGEKKTVNHTTKRFDKYESVLATEGFSSGRHYWEVEVNREFTVGVTKEFSQRKGRFSVSPSVGYWCLYHYRQIFTALEEPSRPLPPDAVPRILGVCIDVDEKWVTFYNNETKAHIYTFKRMNFTDGEQIYPIFSTTEKSADLKIKTVR